MLNTKFRVDIDRLGEYSKFLKKMMVTNNNLLVKMNQENKKLQATVGDEVTKQINTHIVQMKKILDKFNGEVDHLAKVVKEDEMLYRKYNSKLK